MFNPNPNPNPNIWRYNQSQNQSQPPIIIDSESDENDDESPQPGMAAYSRTRHGSRQPSTVTPVYTASLPYEQEKKIRSRLREERHAALCVLMDRELLTIQALAAQETLPQTRRRFLSNLLSPSDPSTAASIRADQLTIQRSSPASAFLSSANIEATAFSGGVLDACETDDSGWFKPDPELASGLSPSSPTPSTKVKGRGTPERSKAKARVSSGRHQQQTRERRRRRWSGAERQDYGAGASF